jgi:hypothetical protein
MQQQDGEVLNLRNQQMTESIVNRTNRDAMLIEELKTVAERMVDLMANIGSGIATGWEIITSPVPSYTHSRGMSAIDGPNRAICR